MNHKKTNHFWREEGLKVPYRKKKKRLTSIGIIVGDMRPIAANVSKVNISALAGALFSDKHVFPTHADRQHLNGLCDIHNLVVAKYSGKFSADITKNMSDRGRWLTSKFPFPTSDVY